MIVARKQSVFHYLTFFTIFGIVIAVGSGCRLFAATKVEMRLPFGSP